MARVDPAALDGILETYKREAPSDVVRTKLDNLHQVCKDLARRGRLTVRAVVNEYNIRFEGSGSLAEPSIRNKRGGANLYNKLFQDWSNWSKGEARHQPRPGEMLLPAELDSIQPVQLRHRIGLMVAEAHSLRSQLSVLQRVNDEQVIRIQGFATVLDPMPMIECAPNLSITIDADDLETLKDFLDNRKLKERGLTLTMDRALVSTTGRTIADPGFFDALKRLVASQG